jgi:hypothetical protein
MAHLTPEQFVDLAEGTALESSMPHLASCDACRSELAGMRALMSEAAGVDVPEPSPLFWNHLSTRVHDAVAEESGRPRSWRERILQPLVLLPSLGAALAVAIFAAVLPRHALAPDLPASPLPFASNVTVPSTSPAAVPFLPPLAPFGAADDPQLTIVAAVATTVDWDEMRDEVAMAAGGTSDAVVGALTVNEQRELQRLLAEEMAQPRAPEKRS